MISPFDTPGFVKDIACRGQVRHTAPMSKLGAQERAERVDRHTLIFRYWQPSLMQGQHKEHIRARLATPGWMYEPCLGNPLRTRLSARLGLVGPWC